MILFCGLMSTTWGQSGELNIHHEIQLTQVYNRIGFGNTLDYHLALGGHHLIAGGTFYTMDTFFQNQTPGFHFGYEYRINGANPKVYFYPGLSASVFNEQKNTLKVLLFEAKAINGVGVHLSSHLSFNYHIGIGAIKTRSILQTNETTHLEYFQYEMGVRLAYQF